MHRLMATWMVLFAFVAASALGGCATSKSTQESAESGGAPATAVVRDERADARRDTSPGFGAYAATVPENIVWIPWKMIGGGFKGAGDGVGAGFAKDRLPAAGVLFSPVNLVVGFVTGFFEGLAMSPGVVGPTDDFGRTMGSPMKRTTSVWWYP